MWYPARIPTSFWLVHTWIALSPPAASPCVSSSTLPSDSVKSHCFKKRLYGFLSPTLLRDGSSPDNTSSPSDRERDRALNAALISAFLSRSQGTAGSEKPDISQPIRFSLSFFFFYKKKMHLLLLFVACARGDFLLASRMFNSQSYKNTICCFEVIQIISRYVKNVIIFFLLYQFGERQFCQNICGIIFTWHLNTCKIL